MNWKRVDSQQSGNEGGGNFTKWRSEGQEIVGTWRGKKHGKYGYFGIAEVEGEDICFSMPTVLTKHLEEIPEGAVIRIVYLGKKEGKSGRSYHDFELYQRDGVL